MAVEKTTIGEKIKTLRERKGMKRPALARLLEIAPNTLYRYECGSIGIKDAMKRRIAEVLEVSVAFLMDETLSEPSGRLGRGREAATVSGDVLRRGVADEGTYFEQEPEPTIPHQLFLPVLNQQACAGNGFSWDDVETEVEEWMPWPVLESGGPTGPHKPYFVRVEGESMIGANIDDGCLILVNPNIEVRSGDIAYVKWNDRCSVKGIIFYNDGRVELRPANNNFKSTWIEKEDIEYLEVLGKVVRWLNMGVPKSIF